MKSAAASIVIKHTHKATIVALTYNMYISYNKHQVSKRGRVLKGVMAPITLGG